MKKEMDKFFLKCTLNHYVCLFLSICKLCVATLFIVIRFSMLCLAGYSIGRKLDLLLNY